MALPLDPSQYVALLALLEERHVTRAARRLGVTQSSMSHRLKQLRESLGDALLVRASGQLVLTPRAAALLPALSAALGALRVAVEPAAPFEASTTRYRVTLALPDLLMPFVPRLLEVLSARAPLVDVSVRHVPPQLNEALAAGAPLLAVAPVAFAAPRLVARSLGAAHFGVVGRRGHPALRRPLTVRRWLAEGHVVMRIDNDSPNVVERELARRGLRRRVALEVPSFLAGLCVVARSNLLMNAPRELAQEVAGQLGLSVRAAPLELPEVPLALLWHERFQGDPAHRFARELTLEVLGPLLGRKAARGARRATPLARGSDRPGP